MNLTKIDAVVALAWVVFVTGLVYIDPEWIPGEICHNNIFDGVVDCEAGFVSLSQHMEGITSYYSYAISPLGWVALISVIVAPISVYAMIRRGKKASV